MGYGAGQRPVPVQVYTPGTCIVNPCHGPDQMSDASWGPWRVYSLVGLTAHTVGRVRTFMRQPLVFSLSSPPRSHPGRYGYARCVLRALRYAVVPLGGPGPGARSRRNLDV